MTSQENCIQSFDWNTTVCTWDKIFQVHVTQDIYHVTFTYWTAQQYTLVLQLLTSKCQTFPIESTSLLKLVYSFPVKYFFPFQSQQAVPATNHKPFTSLSISNYSNKPIQRFIINISYSKGFWAYQCSTAFPTAFFSLHKKQQQPQQLMNWRLMNRK